MERRIARRFSTDSILEIWVPKKGILGRSKTAELPARDLSVFGDPLKAGHNRHLSGSKRGA